MTRLLLLLSIGGLSVLVIVGYMLAKSSLAPIRSIVRKAEGITVTQIDERLPVKNEHDELGELALAFNALLDRVEKTFNDQRMFVSNVTWRCKRNVLSHNIKIQYTMRYKIPSVSLN